MPFSWFFTITKFAIEKQDLLTAPSEWLAQDTEKAFGIPAQRILAIPNFVDLERFTPATELSPVRKIDPNGEFLLTHASNFRRVKRVDDVVKALP